MRNIMVKNKKIWIIAIILALAMPELILAFFYYAAATQDKFENIDKSNFYHSPEGEIYAINAYVFIKIRAILIAFNKKISNAFHNGDKLVKSRLFLAF